MAESDGISSLRMVRLIDRALPTDIDWPLLLPPYQPMDPCQLDYPGLRIKYFQDEIYLAHQADPELADDSSDASYASPEESDGSSSGESSWDTDDSSGEDDVSTGSEVD